MRKSVVILVSLLAMSGCKTTGVKVDLNKNEGYATIKKEYKNIPDLDVITFVTPGEPLISTFQVVEREGIELLETVKLDGKFNGFTNTYIVKQGDLPFIGSGNNGRFYGGYEKLNQIVAASKTDEFVGGGIFIPNSPEENHSIFLDNYHSVIEPLNRKVAFKNKTIIEIPESSFKQELIYTGKSGNNVNVEYREYRGNIARPAFSQSLTFDMSEDDVVGFRGALIEIIKATNSSVEYKVIKHLNHQ